MTGINYRIVTGRKEADIKSLAAITVLSNENPETLSDAIEYFREEFENLDPDKRFLVVALAGTEIVGFCRFTVCPRLHLWWCRGLEVVSEWQRQGVGAGLLKFALNHLGSLGIAEVRSDAAIHNRASRATHARAGFKLVATEGEDFDGRWRADHCFYQYSPESAP